MQDALWTARVDSIDQFRGYLEHVGDVFAARAHIERELANRPDASFYEAGFCGVCKRETQFQVDRAYGFPQPDGSILPNYRERLECQHCRLNTRLRGALQFSVERAGLDPRHRIYATEQTTSYFRALSERFPAAVGSEYLSDGTVRGAYNMAGIRHEDSTDLTFPTASFDAIMSFDVLEHVPDYNKALTEYARCTKPGGTCFITAPFALGQYDHIVRARLVDGQIEHILPPEYHGDPLNIEGVLCFYHFGWALLDDLRKAGFESAAMNFYWSKHLGYLGGNPFIITAHR